jgi:hypothetical protein
MNKSLKAKIEFGDFQTPAALADQVCGRLVQLGISPINVIEPTCGVGAFVLAASKAFPGATAIHGAEVNPEYLQTLSERIPSIERDRIQLVEADFFTYDWKDTLKSFDGELLVLGNFPWVTSSVQGAIGGVNLPEKSNFQGRSGFDAISGAANFDISEWMLLEVFRWFDGRSGAVAMLVKTGVARKVLAQAEKMTVPVVDAMTFGIDAKKEFGAAVDACLLVVRIGNIDESPEYDYTIFSDLDAVVGRRVGHRGGLTINDLDMYERYKDWLGPSPQKWRSGVKHDASSVMELTRIGDSTYENGLGEIVCLESEFLFPLLKGSDVGSNKPWRQKFIIVSQRIVGAPTSAIEFVAPKTWNYLKSHGDQLDARRSSIYIKGPRFSIFGVGEYAFRPWRIAICSLYKRLRFRLVEPIDGKPVMFDDTVYYVSFDTREEAEEVVKRLDGEAGKGLLSSLIFWDEKRPIKTGILNSFDWGKDSRNLRLKK